MTPEIPRLKQQNSGSRIVNFHPQVSPQLPAVLEKFRDRHIYYPVRNSRYADRQNSAELSPSCQHAELPNLRTC
jgi:hypothetical protein